MLRTGFFLFFLTLTRIASAQEIPPYDPAPVPNMMTAYTNAELAFTILYPKEFAPGTPQDLQAVMDRGHHSAYGTEPKTDPEHREAIRCMHPLLYATAPLQSSNGSSQSTEESPDTIMAIDLDRSCAPKKLKGDKALTALAGTVLNLPNFTQLIQQMWFVAGGDRRIHSGMAGTMIKLDASPATDKQTSIAPKEIPYYVMASSFEQRGHWLLVVYLSGTAGDKHLAVPHMSVAFDGEKPVLLYPYLLGKSNYVK